jgi:hypothetical protein
MLSRSIDRTSLLYRLAKNPFRPAIKAKMTLTTSALIVNSLDSTQILTQAIAAILEGKSDRSPAADLVSALLGVEKLAKQTKLDILITDLAGEWQLSFATGAKKFKNKAGVRLGRGYYFPQFIPASISFTPDQANPNIGEIANQVAVGLVRLKLTGPYRYLGKKNLLAFDFVDFEVRILDRVVYQGKMPKKQKIDRDFASKSIAQLPFFSFISASNNGIAARGRGGGLALWVRN